jgi:hypothetical protein
MDDAYAAGIIDGEGCIRIQHNVRKNGCDVWSLRVAISNTSYRLLVAIQAEYGGRISLQRSHTNYPTRRDLYEWRLSDAKAAAFLLRVRPFLLVKAEQADMAISFRDTVLPLKGRTRGNSAETTAKRLSLVKEITEAKHAC